MPKKRYKFSDEEKQQAVDAYVSGRRRAEEIAKELGVPQGYLYKWRVQLEERNKGERVGALEAEGRSPKDARRIAELEAEVAEYQRKLGEMTLIQDLLKKRLRSTNSQERSELTGLIETLERSVQKGVRAK